MILLITLALVAILIGAAKAISDRVDNTSTWRNSVFANLNDKGVYTNQSSFIGSKNKTWQRKNRFEGVNVILNYLFRTILVGVTDLWHFGNTIRYLLWCSAVIIAYYLPHTNYTIWAITAALLGIRASFHVFYTHILYKKRK